MILENQSSRALKNSAVQVTGLSDSYGLKNRGYFLEVDLHYPTQLHNLHDDYPLLATQTVISHDDLSPLQRQQHNDQAGAVLYCTVLYCTVLYIPILLYTPDASKRGKYSAEKLVLTLDGVQNYVVHSSNLELMCRLGVEVVKIHK